LPIHNVKTKHDIEYEKKVNQSFWKRDNLVDDDNEILALAFCDNLANGDYKLQQKFYKKTRISELYKILTIKKLNNWSYD
jgi:hypothetical protein